VSRLAPLSGFPEYLPSQRQAELKVIQILSRTFELHGFANIETRSVETLERLSIKGDIENEIYLLRRIHEPDSDVGAGDSLGGLALHYDLTVPLARYIVEHAGKLEFPFRRYQIQKAWRGERPQEGRYREFTQADIDIVGKDELGYHFDVEVVAVMAEAMAQLPVPLLRVQLNNRLLIEGYVRGIGADDPFAVMRQVDKLDKVSPDQVRDLLVSEAGLTAGQADQTLRLATIRTPDSSFVDQVRGLGVQHELLDQGLDQLAAAVDGCQPFVGERLTVEADLRIARGLSYYTGTVFETRMSGYEHIGSVCSGGRYDALATDGKTTYPGVGISFGITRTLYPLISRGLLDANRSVPSAVLIALVREETRAQSNTIADKLRARGIPTEVAPAAQKYGRQIRYAERRGIPYVWFPPSDADATDQAKGHQVKNIRSGEQHDADPSAWEPPSDDLHPRVTPSHFGPNGQEPVQGTAQQGEDA
jgi:histidyl-tRNA synthetase